MTVFRHPLLLMLLLAMPRLATAAPSDVSAEIFADTAAIEPGKPFRLAVRLTPHPGWHIYWQNAGDAGLPTKITFHLPPGFTAAPLAYPLPEKLPLPGGILDYGYPRATTFLTTITPLPATPAPTPATIAITASASWLSCKESCVPGRTTLELKLPVGGAAPDHADIFDPAQSALAAPVPPNELADAHATRTTPDHIQYQLHWKSPVTNVDLFPLAVDGLEVSDIKADTHDRTTTITFTTRVLAGQNPSLTPLPVLIVYTDSAGKPRGFYTWINIASPLTGDAK